MTLNSINIYSNNGTLFITDGDHNLIEVSGEQVPVIVQILECLLRKEKLDDTFSQVSHLVDNDQDFFNEIIDWLVENKILLRPINQPKKIINIFFKNIKSATARKEFVNILNEECLTASYKICEDIQEANLVLYFAPIFEDYSSFVLLNEFAYKNNINILHIGIDRASFTLGPLVVPKQKTPCLRCYLKRKLSNLKNPEAVLNFSKYLNKNTIKKNLVEDNRYFQTVATYIRVELSKFYDSGEIYSSLMAKSIFFDNAIYEISKSRILRTPTCSVCQKNNFQTALNL